MLFKLLRKHQWRAFSRNPMFERNLILTIFMFIIFGIVCLEFLIFGAFLDEILLKLVPDNLAIHTFNSFILYFFMFDFIIKYILKRPQSMQMVPYLTLPIKRKTLFNFLLTKEFSNIWNLYFLFLIFPFAFNAIPEYFGYLTTVLYILFFYLSCIINSLLVNISNNLLKRNGWFVLLPYIIIGVIIILNIYLNLNLEKLNSKIWELLLNNNLLIWLCLIIFFSALWLLSQSMMRKDIYRGLQNEKASKVKGLLKLSFFEKFGEIGYYMSLELKMILRSKKIKQQIYALAFLLVYFFIMVYIPSSAFQNEFMYLFFSMFTIGGLGLTMGQLMFATESSFFDGLISRPHNILTMMKAKYILYIIYALFSVLIMTILVFQGKLSLLFLGAVLFYTIGPVFFLMFQNAVYNKYYIELSDGGMFNWKNTSGNSYLISILGMFIPLVLVLIISAIFSKNIAYYFMLAVGIIFTVTANKWIKWTYERFLKRKYKNMEGFRSNA